MPDGLITVRKLLFIGCGALACIIHQRWKVSRTVIGIEVERQEARQIWG
jgi:hypothetical protein